MSEQQNGVLKNLDARETKIFRDTVHGYISIPTDYVKSFIDTELFQRLRNIEQTGMRALYPSARHDRFIHSLGVYHLGHKAFLCFKQNVARHYADSHYKVLEDGAMNELFWNRCQVLFEIACLLHDCGHAPFSHTLEFFYNLEPSFSDKLKEYFPSESDLSRQGAPHERMSALMVSAEYSKEIKSLLEQYGLRTLGDPSEDREDPTELIARMITGCPYVGISLSCQIKNCLISLLNSDSIDVDSLDYIIRDAAMSGIDNMSIDLERLLNSLTLVEITEFNGYIFRRPNDIRAAVLKGAKLESTPNARAFFSGRLDGVLTARGNCSLTIESGTIVLSGQLRALASPQLHETNRIKKTITVSGHNYNHSPIPMSDEEAKMVLTGQLKEKLPLTGSNLRFDATTNARIRLEADNIHFPAHAYVDGKWTGRFTGTLLGNHKDKGGDVKLKLGFNKSSLSVIQNVVIARNYEYQWVYSHHKVVYYANYLLIELLRAGVRFLLEHESSGEKTIKDAMDCIVPLLSWKAMIDPAKEDEPECGPQNRFGTYFWRPTDADILALFKRCQIEARKALENPPSKSGATEAFVDLMEQYSTRTYRKSLWKSYAEMRNFLSEFTADEVQDILEKCLITQAEEGKKRLKKNYGYLNEEWAEKFRACGMNDVVWVSGKSKLKSIDPDETYIHFKNRDMTYGDVSSLNSVTPTQEFDLFYIYYRPVPDIEVDDHKTDLIDFLRSQLSKSP